MYSKVNIYSLRIHVKYMSFMKCFGLLFKTCSVPENSLVPGKNSQLQTIYKCIKSLQQLKLTIPTGNKGVKICCY